MRNTNLLAICVLFCSVLGVGFIAPQDKGQPKGASLDTHMKAMNASMKQLREYLKAPKDPVPVAVIVEMQRHALEAKGLEPKKASTKAAGEERAKFMLAYKQEMKKLIVGLIDLELAFEQKDWTAAGKQLDELDGDKKEGHDAFKGKGK